jgi:hypothetical protein
MPLAILVGFERCWVILNEGKKNGKQRVGGSSPVTIAAAPPAARQLSAPSAATGDLVTVEEPERTAVKIGET